MNAYYHGMKIIDVLEYREGNKHSWAIVKLDNGNTVPVRTDFIVIE